MNKHVKLFESFFRGEDSNIYEEQKIYNEDTLENMYKDDLELQREIYKTWIIDYINPMLGLEYDDPKLQSLVSSAKIWLNAIGIVTKREKEEIYYQGSSQMVETGGPLTNGEIVGGLYFVKEMFTPSSFDRPVGPTHISRQEPLLTSMYALIDNPKKY